MKKTFCFSLIIFLQVAFSFAQAPVVSNVSFAQRTDGSLIVDIYYDLSDGDGETKTIQVEASNDNGSTWDLTCTSLTGDVGSGVTLGTGKHIVWDFYADNPDESGSQYKVRITASEVGTMTGNDGKTYATVKIGSQWWMAENLKETQYRNGDAIPVETDNATWAGLSTGARCAYNNSETTANTYGYLYNWYAVDDSRFIASSGWHVPSDAEWSTLSTYLGGTNVAGGKMKEIGTSKWLSPNTSATNESGFTAFPGGARTYNSGTYYELGEKSKFWSTTDEGYSDDAWMRFLTYNRSLIYFAWGYKKNGYSIRLVKD